MVGVIKKCWTFFPFSYKLTYVYNHIILFSFSSSSFFFRLFPLHFDRCLCWLFNGITPLLLLLLLMVAVDNDCGCNNSAETWNGILYLLFCFGWTDTNIYIRHTNTHRYKTYGPVWKEVEKQQTPNEICGQRAKGSERGKNCRPFQWRRLFYIRSICNMHTQLLRLIPRLRLTYIHTSIHVECRQIDIFICSTG